jgi:hypothetical protein
MVPITSDEKAINAAGLCDTLRGAQQLFDTLRWRSATGS